MGNDAAISEPSGFLLFAIVFVVFAILIGLISLFGWLLTRRDERRAARAAAHVRPPREMEGASAPPRMPNSAAPQPPPAARPLALREWLDIVQHRPDQVPHALVIAPSGAGKTTLLEALMVDRADQVVIIDPDWQPGRWGGAPVVTVGADGEFGPIEQIMQQLLRELKDRAAAVQRGDVPRDLTIVWDEIPETVEECPSAGEFLRRLVRRGRKYHMRLIGGSQSERVQALGLKGQGDALTNAVIIRLDRSRRGLLEFERETYPIDISRIPDLAQRPVPAARWWSRPRDEISAAPDADRLLAQVLSEPPAPERSRSSVQASTNGLNARSALLYADLDDAERSRSAATPAETPDESLPATNVQSQESLLPTTVGELQQLAKALTLRAQGATKQAAVEAAFGVTKGGSREWKRASRLFDVALGGSE